MCWHGDCVACKQGWELDVGQDFSCKSTLVSFGTDQHLELAKWVEEERGGEAIANLLCTGKLLSPSQSETIGINQRARYQELAQYVGTVAKEIFSYCKYILNYLSCIYRVIIFHCINHLTPYKNVERNSSLVKVTLLTWKQDCFEMFPLDWLFA